MNKVPRWVFCYVGNETFDFSSKSWSRFGVFIAGRDRMPEFTWFLNIFFSVNKKNSFSSTSLSQDFAGSHQTHRVELHLIKEAKIRACCGYEDCVDGDGDMMSRV